jgi:sulfur carrier protein
MSAAMTLTINGQPRAITLDAPEVASLLEALQIPTIRGVAVALNDQVVPRSQWASTPVADGDQIEIIQATQGG